MNDDGKEHEKPELPNHFSMFYWPAHVSPCSHWAFVRRRRPRFSSIAHELFLSLAQTRKLPSIFLLNFSSKFISCCGTPYAFTQRHNHSIWLDIPIIYMHSFWHIAFIVLLYSKCGHARVPKRNVIMQNVRGWNDTNWNSYISNVWNEFMSGETWLRSRLSHFMQKIGPLFPEKRIFLCENIFFS